MEEDVKFIPKKKRHDRRCFHVKCEADLINYGKVLLFTKCNRICSSAAVLLLLLHSAAYTFEFAEELKFKEEKKIVMQNAISVVVLRRTNVYNT